MKNKVLALSASVLLLSGIAFGFASSNGACCEKQGVANQTSAASCESGEDCPTLCCGGGCCGQ